MNLVLVVAWGVLALIAYRRGRIAVALFATWALGVRIGLLAAP